MGTLWQHQGEELATSQTFHCLLFTRTVDCKQWHALSLGNAAKSGAEDQGGQGLQHLPTSAEPMRCLQRVLDTVTDSFFPHLVPYFSLFSDFMPWSHLLTFQNVN